MNVNYSIEVLTGVRDALKKYIDTNDNIVYSEGSDCFEDREKVRDLDLAINLLNNFVPKKIICSSIDQE